MTYLVDIILDDSALPEPTPEIAQERRVAIFDLLQENEFIVVREGSPKGPYKLLLGMQDRRLVFTVSTALGEPAGQFMLSLSPLKQVIKDYFAICESYFKAVTTMPPAQIEAIDMGRRGIHDEVCDFARIFAASLPHQQHSLSPQPLDHDTRRQQ